MNFCVIAALARLSAAAPCLISGDSIAVDLAAAMPQCAVDAQNCIPSAAIIRRIHASPITVISAGSNDPRNPQLSANLHAIRAKATGRVIWIVPADSRAGGAVRDVAAATGDAAVAFTPGPDRVHPASNQALAAAVRGAMEK